MTEQAHIPVREHEPDLYASHDDFHTVFNENLKELYQLYFQLMRDHKTAERCLVSGLEDCVTENRIFRDWARLGATRTIIQNAIPELKPRSSPTDLSASEAILPDQLPNRPDGHFSIDAELSLEDLERFAFLMSVLERYSEHDCILFLGCWAREVRVLAPAFLGN